MSFAQSTISNNVHDYSMKLVDRCQISFSRFDKCHVKRVNNQLIGLDLSLIVLTSNDSLLLMLSTMMTMTSSTFCEWEKFVFRILKKRGMR